MATNYFRQVAMCLIQLSPLFIVWAGYRVGEWWKWRRRVRAGVRGFEITSREK